MRTGIRAKVNLHNVPAADGHAVLWIARTTHGKRCRRLVVGRPGEKVTFDMSKQDAKNLYQTYGSK